ncbi:uncharacterized protein L969DRAFT_554214 [Mixia osmundae IAM 14324]|uniref:Dephospho-CoA kinase n=1 Tax=Mixia osmundae (strain CBS 9802 / IAM 14324 / JCM 22182 / KY 12970) TaxID=764103 RepID=G7E0P5_MIXOS|nr:uncharacterized protein L969DRAFT_554214 [Mixia osmundae IAM 14324]KEI37881.1 hypothetical protein L969DRAFT_554214 [Mixia osmundae IAM 14324]GAA96405.1 hypothetical protein E5Q_03072 [Mixia osmundae IAM 14324]
MLIVGLTGGIASGKSTVSKLLSEEHRLPVIDLDILARQAVEPGTLAYRAIVAHFGPDILLSSSNDVRGPPLDRAKLGEIVFSDERQRKVLNSITHPAVRRLMAWEIARCWLRGEGICVVDAPLLVEAGLWRLCGRVCVVYCSDQLQVKRLQQRNDFSPESARSRIASQRPLSSKLVYADDVIDNSGTLSDLEYQVNALVVKLKSARGSILNYGLSWLIPPLGLLRGLLCIAIRLGWKKIGQERKRSMPRQAARQRIRDEQNAAPAGEQFSLDRR